MRWLAATREWTFGMCRGLAARTKGNSFMKLIKSTAAALFAAGAVMTVAAPALAADENWIKDDMKAAMEKAKAEGKDIIIDFTGSDWCGWCIRLDNEVFSQSEFKETVPNHFVLVALDFPTEKVPQTDEVKAHNKQWQEKFSIRGFPTIVLTDANGEEYARTGYRQGGPTPYVEHLSQLREGKVKRDESLAAAEKASGIDKAKHLDAALSIEGIVVPNAEQKMETIIALDADNAAGLKEKYEGQLKELRLQNALSEAETLAGSGKTDEALAKFDEIEANFDLDAEQFMNVSQMRIYALMNAGNNDAAEKAIANAMTRDDLTAEQRQMIAVARINIVYPTGDNARIRQVALEVIEIAPDSGLAGRLKAFVEGLPTEDEG